jgi:hypothetical protein
VLARNKPGIIKVKGMRSNLCLLLIQVRIPHAERLDPVYCCPRLWQPAVAQMLIYCRICLVLTLLFLEKKTDFIFQVVFVFVYFAIVNQLIFARPAHEGVQELRSMFISRHKISMFGLKIPLKLCDNFIIYFKINEKICWLSTRIYRFERLSMYLENKKFGFLENQDSNKTDLRLFLVRL